MIAGAIDIGSNTTLALLAELQDGELLVLKDQLTFNGLGDSLKETDELPRDTIALNIDLLNEIVREFKRDGAEAIAATGTAALRRAMNRAAFVGAAKQVLGLTVDVLSGREEAALTFAGAISGREIYPNEAVGVMDIGGGSTELIQGKGTQPTHSTSLDLGSVYLTNQFFKNDPPTAQETQSLKASLQDRLPLLIGGLGDRTMPWTLVSGTAVSLAMLKRGLRRYDPAAVRETFLSRDDLDAAIVRLSGMSTAEIQNLPGLPPGRARFILAGTLLMRELFDVLRIEEGIVSERGLRHGLWLARFSNQNV